MPHGQPPNVPRPPSPKILWQAEPRAWLHQHPRISTREAGLAQVSQQVGTVAQEESRQTQSTPQTICLRFVPRLTRRQSRPTFRVESPEVWHPILAFMHRASFGSANRNARGKYKTRPFLVRKKQGATKATGLYRSPTQRQASRTRSPRHPPGHRPREHPAESCPFIKEGGRGEATHEGQRRRRFRTRSYDNGGEGGERGRVFEWKHLE